MIIIRDHGIKLHREGNRDRWRVMSSAGWWNGGLGYLKMQ